MRWARARASTRSGRCRPPACSRSTASCGPQSPCGPARCNAGASFTRGFHDYTPHRAGRPPAARDRRRRHRPARACARSRASSSYRDSAPTCWCKAGAPGTYALRSLPFNQGEGPNRTWVLANVVVAGEPMPMDLPTALPRRHSRPSAPRSSPGTKQITFQTQSPAHGRRRFPRIPLHDRRPPVRSQSHRPPHSPGRRRGVGNRQSRRGRSSLPHSHQPVPGDEDQRRRAGRARSGATPSTCAATKR